MSTMTPLSTGPSPMKTRGSGRRKSFAALAAGTLLATGVTIAPSLLSFTGANAATVLQGKTFYDLNKNGVQDVTAVAQTNETAISGVPITVTAANGTVGTGASGANGAWTVTMSADGPYRVEFGAFAQPCPAGVNAPCVVPGVRAGGTTVQFPATGGTTTVNLGVFAKFNGLGSIESLIGGNQVEIGDRVWEDTNGNGIQDPGEPGIAGVTVNLVDSFTGNPTGGSTTTDANGYYIFKVQDTLPYTVRVDSKDPKLAGYTLTKGGQGNRAIDSDPAGLDANGIAVAVVPPRNPEENDHTFDFGWVPPAKLGSLGDYVFLDANRNGTQDDGDAAVQGATVTLLNADNTPVAGVAPQVTKADGKYLFDKLPAGSYKVKFERPAGSNVTPTIGAQGDPALDSNIGTDGITNTITLGAGQNDLTVDAGWVVPEAPKKGALGDFVFLDANQDGIQNNNEAGIPDAIVNLLDASGNPVLVNGAAVTTTTDANGKYEFTNLDSTVQYIVEFKAPTALEGQVLRSPADVTTTGATDANDSDANVMTGRTGLNSVPAGGKNDTVDSGWYPKPTPAKAAIGNFVFLDANKNGIQDGGEAGIQGVTVRLLDANGNAIAGKTAITDGNGGYAFTGLDPATYIVEFVAPAGYTASPADVTTTGATDENDSDANITTGRTRSYTLAAGQTDNSVDAGYFPTQPAKAALGNFVFEDVNDNGIQDEGEPGIDGVTVILYRRIAGTINFSIVRTTTTSGGGLYIFDNLDPSASPSDQFVVGFQTPTGFTLAKANIGNDGTDSDAVQTGQAGLAVTQLYTLAPAERNLTVDAGYVRIVAPKKYTLGDRVFLDSNNNGLQDANEVGIVGVKVELLDTNANVLASQNTIADGRYTFFDLNPGQYRVRFTAPSGTAFTSRFSGTDRGLDSNVDGNGLSDLINLTANDATIDAGIVGAPVTVPPSIVPPNTTPTTVAPTTTVPAPGTVCVGDKVFTDPGSTGGAQAKDGKGIAGVTVTLVRADGTSVSATTDANGNYKFCGLPAGTYTVKVNPSTLPKGSTNTYDLDGDRNSETKVVLTTTDNLDVDFGYIFPVVENTVVTTPPPSATVPPAPADVLSYTGSESTQRGLMGLSMLLIGFGLVGLARGRRRRLGA